MGRETSRHGGSDGRKLESLGRVLVGAFESPWAEKPGACILCRALEGKKLEACLVWHDDDERAMLSKCTMRAAPARLGADVERKLGA